MNGLIKKALALALLAALGVSLAGCGKKKEPDAAAQQVLKIAVTPEITPTRAPGEIDSSAVVTNGSFTMVNEYLAAKDSGASGDNAAGTDGGSPDGAGTGDAGAQSGEDGTQPDDDGARSGDGEIQDSTGEMEEEQ